MKRLRIGRRRARVERSATPLELALAPALVDGRWEIPDRFNFTRDVVEALAEDPKRRALTFSGQTGIIEPLTFHRVAESATRWAAILRQRDVGPGDRVLVLVQASAEWFPIVLGCLKVGAVTVQGPASPSAAALEVLLAATGTSLVVADHGSDRELAQLSFEPEIQYLDEVEEVDEEAGAATHDTSSRDVAFIFASSGTSGEPRIVAHTHGSTFATRVQAEHWLDATRGDAVWCTGGTGTAHRVWSGLLGPWSRGAELVLHDGPFDAQERLDLVHRLGVTVLCQAPGEYRALAELRLRDLERYRPRRLRRLVSTGDYLEPDVLATFEEAWGMTIHDGFGSLETNVVVANGADAGFKPGALGLPLPGHQVSVVDHHGNELPPGIEGDLAVRDRPPTLFSGYWDQPDETKAALAGDWYRTGDVAARDEDGFLWFVGKSSDVISARGRVFGPHEVERVLREHDAVRHAAVVGVSDLERGGHFVRAFVVLGPRKTGSEQLEAELRQHVADHLPEQQVPREVAFVDVLPTTPTGEIRRDDLRQRPVPARPLTAPAAGAAIAPEEPPAPAPVEATPAPELPAPPPPPEPLVEPVVEPVVKPVVEATGAVEFPSDEAVEAYDPVLASLGGIESVPAADEAPPGEIVAETVQLPEPEPEPELVSEPVEPVAESALEPAVEEIVEPVVEPDAGPRQADEPAVPEPTAPPGFEPDPQPAAEPETEAWIPPEAAPLPDYVVERTVEPVAPPLPEPEPEPEVPEGPLPDYIVDPSRPRPVEPEPATAPRAHVEPPAAAEPEPEPPLAGLGIRPVTEFPRRESSPGDETPARRRRTRAEQKPDSSRSLGDPGDEPEEVGWMQGLSSRLSAYSLGGDLDQAADGPEDPAEADDEAEADDTEREDGTS